MDDPGRIRWRELFQGRRQWAASDNSLEGLRIFGVEVIDPLKAMENTGMIFLHLNVIMREGRPYYDAAHITAVCSWVGRLISGGASGADNRSGIVKDLACNRPQPSPVTALSPTGTLVHTECR